MSEKRDAYVEEMKAKLDQWNAGMDKFQVKANQATADVLVDYKYHLERIKAKRAEFEGKMSELKSSGEGAWEELKTGVENSWQTMGDALHAAKSKFR
jgi:SMC interacting uncharacterized protein involved in chromosome segregation